MNLEMIKEDEIKERQINLLNALDEFCRKNNIVYYLAYGTLLGAVRHKGYIPWDDDIDVMMPREDFNRFVKLFKDDQYIIGYTETVKDWPFLFGKLFDNDTILYEDLDYKHVPYGINIDIFPLDYAPENKIKRFFYHKKIWLYCCMFSVQITDVNIMTNNTKKRVMCMLKKLIPFNIQQIKKRVEAIVNKHNDRYRNVGYSFVLGLNAKKEIAMYENDLFDGITQLSFEGKKYFAPKKYHEILTIMYNDYMKLPPIEQQVTHHSYKVYKKNV